MKLTPLVLVAAFSIPVFAQAPPESEADQVPAPLPMEGKKKLDPMPTHGKGRPHSPKALRPKLPVAPPTPDPNRIDPVK